MLSEKIVKAVVAQHRPSFRILRQAGKIKTFIKNALQPGTTIGEAKALAGLPPATNTRDLLSSPVGKATLDMYLAEDFTPEEIRKKIKELWDAETPIYGEGGVFLGSRPHYEIQDKQLTRVLKMRGYADTGEEEGVAKQPPTQIIFNTIVEAEALSKEEK